MNAMFLETVMYYYETDETKKESLKETLVKETIAYFMERFNNFVKKNNGYLATGHVCIFKFSSRF